jgi:hypothetical protein
MAENISLFPFPRRWVAGARRIWGLRSPVARETSGPPVPALRSGEELYRQLFERNPIAVWSLRLGRGHLVRDRRAPCACP